MQFRQSRPYEALRISNKVVVSAHGPRAFVNLKPNTRVQLVGLPVEWGLGYYADAEYWGEGTFWFSGTGCRHLDDFLSEVVLYVYPEV